MVKKIEEAKQKNFENKLKKHQNASGPVTISCKRKKFNHHRGQKYSDFSPHMLASGGWKHRNSKGDHFTLHAISGVSILLSPQQALILTISQGQKEVSIYI